MTTLKFRKLAELHTASTDHPGLIGVAWEHANSKRTFRLMDPDAFVETYGHLRPTERCHHEELLPHRPVCLFFDLELKNSNITLDEWIDGRVNRLIHIVREHLPTTADPILWHANRPGKFSCHAIFPDLWFQCTADLLTAVTNLHANHLPRELHSPVVDLNLYSAITVRSLRMAYSGHYTTDPVKPRNLLRTNPAIQELGENPTEPFCPVLMRRSLLTAPPPGTVFQPSTSAGAPPPSKRPLAWDDTLTAMQPRLDRLTDWLREVKYVKEIELDWRSGPGALNYLCHPGVFCPFINGRHGSNGVYLRVRYNVQCPQKTMEGAFFCLSCRLSWETEVPLSFLAFPEEAGAVAAATTTRPNLFH